MKPWTTWLARLGIAGACFIVTGCGGSDVPDASSDGQAATESPSGGAPPAEPAANAGAKVAANDDQAAKADEPAAEPAAPAQAQESEPPPAGAKKDEAKGNSKTAEMLAMATGPSGGGSNPPADGSAPPADGSTSAAPNTPAPDGSGGPAAGGQGASPSPGPGGGSPGRPGLGTQAQQGQQQQGRQMAELAARAQASQRGQANQGAGAPGGQGGQGGPGGPGAPGAAGVDNTPADFHSPEGAVQAFLSALKAKDLDRLNEATALRAQVEASGKNQGLFKKIFDLSLSDSELDDLAKKLEGYQLAGENPAKSTGKIEVILRKQSERAGGYFLRKVTVRHEKKGWGVLDIAGAQEFKPLNSMPARRNTGGGNRNN